MKSPASTPRDRGRHVVGLAYSVGRHHGATSFQRPKVDCLAYEVTQLAALTGRHLAPSIDAGASPDHPTCPVPPLSCNVSGTAVRDRGPHAFSGKIFRFPCYARFVQLRGLNHGAARTRSWVAAEILMLTYLPPATCGVVCTSMTLPLKDPGSAVPAICRHTAIGMITDSAL
jgi:hypothetical protein